MEAGTGSACSCAPACLLHHRNYPLTSLTQWSAHHRTPPSVNATHRSQELHNVLHARRRAHVQTVLCPDPVPRLANRLGTACEVSIWQHSHGPRPGVLYVQCSMPNAAAAASSVSPVAVAPDSIAWISWRLRARSAVSMSAIWPTSSSNSGSHFKCRNRSNTAFASSGVDAPEFPGVFVAFPNGAARSLPRTGRKGGALDRDEPSMPAAPSSPEGAPSAFVSCSWAGRRDDARGATLFVLDRKLYGTMAANRVPSLATLRDPAAICVPSVRTIDPAALAVPLSPWLGLGDAITRGVVLTHGLLRFSVAQWSACWA